MKRIGLLILAISILGVFYACDSGRQGFSYERNADNSIGPKLPNVEIVFTSEDSSLTETVITDADAHYKIILPPDRYYVYASHPDFQSYSSAPGFSVVTKGKIGTLNIFLKEGGKQGQVLERLQDGSIGDPIPNTSITFTSEDGTITKSVTSSSGGSYKIVLDPVRYVVTADHPDFEPFTTAPGFSVCTEGEFTTFNIFMTRE